MNNQMKFGAILSYVNIVVKNLVTFLYTPFLLRFVGQANYGLFQMTNSVMVSLSLLSMGFSSSYVRFYIVYKVKKDFKRISKLNALYLILFSVISAISLVIGFFLVINTKTLFGRSMSNHEVYLMRYLMLIMIFDVALTFISSVFDSNITVNEKFIFQQIRQLIQTLLVPAICIPLIFIGFGVLSIEITQIFITSVFLIMNIRYCLRKLKMKFCFQNLSSSLLKELIAFSFFIFLNQIVDLVNNNVPNFILGIVQGAKLVATFAIAVQLKNMFFMLSTALSSVFIPRVNQYVNLGKSTDFLTDLMIKVGRIQMSVLFFILGGFIVIGRYFIKVWAGNVNESAYALVIIMVLPTIIPLSQNIGIEIQRAMNKHIFRSIAYIIFAVLNVIITLIGAARYGLFGASLGYVVSILGANGFLMNWYYQSRMGLNMKRYWKKTLTVSLPFLFSVSMLLSFQVFVKVNSIGTFMCFGVGYVLLYLSIYYMWIANDYEKIIIGSLIMKSHQGGI